MRFWWGLVVVLATAGSAEAQTPATLPDLLYDDPAGNSSASVVQVWGNAPPTTQVLGSVSRISIRGEVFVIQWGHGAVSLLPRQYVLSISLNQQKSR